MEGITQYRVTVDFDSTSPKIYDFDSYPGKQWEKLARLAGEGRWSCRLETRYVNQKNIEQPWVCEWRVMAECPRDSQDVVIIGGTNQP